MLCLALWKVATALAESPALVRDSTVATVQTLQGTVPARLIPIAPSRYVTLILLADMLAADDVVRIKREISAAISTPFLTAHKLQIVFLSGSGGDFSTPLVTNLQLQAALKQVNPGKGSANAPALLETLGSVPAQLPGSWAQAVVIGRLPAVAKDESWVSAWLSEIYRKQRVRLSFWSLDSAAPAWAQSAAAGAMGVVATGSFNSLLPMLNDSSSYFEVNWETKLSRGAWPYAAEIKNAAGERVAAVAALMTGAGYTPMLQAYLSARAEFEAASVSDEAATERLLSVNPSDLDGLRRRKVSVENSKLIAEITPLDASIWEQLGKAEFSAQAFDDAEKSLLRAAELGVKNASTLELQARLCQRKNDFAGALAFVDEALKSAAKQQALWLLRAEYSRTLKLGAKEIESLERAAVLGEIPPVWSKDLAVAYLDTGNTAKAIPLLRKSQSSLPLDAGGLIEYANLWERARQPKEAEGIWQKALQADPKVEAAYVGLIANYTATERYAEAGKIADSGLSVLPKSLPLLSAKERALEQAGDIYGARRLLAAPLGEGSNIELIKRRAELEDVYGGVGSDSYLALIKALTEQNAAQSEIVAACRRGFTVALREEHLNNAQMFADRLAKAGDRASLDLLTTRLPPSTQRVEIPGGVEAFEFLLFGHSNGKVDLVQALQVISAAIANRHAPIDPNSKTEWQHFESGVHEYFQRIASLNALGQRKDHLYEIVLSLKDKQNQQRTEKVFDILGLKMHRDKEGVSVKSAEGKSQIKKQGVLAALEIDEQAIEEALAQGKSYSLEIPFDVVPVFPSEEYWRNGFFDKEKLPGGLAEAFANDIRLPRLYSALNSMDRTAAQALVQAVQPKNLLERDSAGLWLYAAALALNGNLAEVPGGTGARAVWANLAGADPSSGAVFFEALLHKDDGRLISFFYTLSQLDVEHQRFFTRSAARGKVFYQLFRESQEARHGGADTRLWENGYVRFLREVPLNDDLSVDFPGSPEVWMVAKGLKSTGDSVAKMSRQMKKTAAPEDEDQILLRLASTDYKYLGRQETELANLVVVSRIDAQRSEPLTPESALVLAQSYATHPGLYPYFARLGDLETADYRKILSLETKCDGVDSAVANLRLGELHAFLALAGAAHASGLVPVDKFLPLFRKGLDRLMAARDGAAFTEASLAFVSELLPYAKLPSISADAAIRGIVLSEAGANREKAFDQVLALQKIPSLDDLLLVDHDLQKLNGPPAVFDDMQRAVERLTVLEVPKAWKVTGERKKSLELYDNAQAIKLITKGRLIAAKRKRSEEADLQRIANELRAELEPWVELALVGRIYARYLDASDLLVSEDPQLVRKHEFVTLNDHVGKPELFGPARMLISSESEGSYFTGGLADFSVVAGQVRAAGNHVTGSGGQFFATSLFASVRATDWRGFNAAVLLSFGTTIRLAREWIVESATAPDMRAELSDAARGILSLARRKALLQGLEMHEWNAVWQAVSVSDLHFLGDALRDKAPAGLWREPHLQAMKRAAQHTGEADMLGSVAPGLSGSAEPQLRRYEPYEEYQRHIIPDLLSERLAELKVNLAWLADNAAWEPERLIRITEPAADEFLSKLKMRDSWDWTAALDAYRNLKMETLEALASRGEP